jgi:hypothetical protein
MSENEKVIFNPMKGVVAEANVGGLPIGNYVGKFVEAKYFPEQEADAMTGEGGRQWAKIVFKWEILEGEYKDKFAIRETPHSMGVKAAYVAVCGFVCGKQLTPKDEWDLVPFVGRKYLLTVSQKLKKDGTATNWNHVSNAMLVP